jgi:hypothetical protein
VKAKTNDEYRTAEQQNRRTEEVKAKTNDEYRTAEQQNRGSGGKDE